MNHYILTLIIIASGGIPKGYDEGGFAGVASLHSFQRHFSLDTSHHNPDALTNLKANIVSFGVLGAAAGAVLSLCATDRFGRLRTWQALTVVWATGTLATMFARGVGFLLFGRIWSGAGAGGLSVVAPLYLSEVAPARTRGRAVSAYMLILLGFLMIGFFACFAVDETMRGSSLQYRVVLAVPLVPVGAAFAASFWLGDTPRWLASKGRAEEALRRLARLRGASAEDESVKKEWEGVRSPEEASPWSSVVKEVVQVPSYRSRFLLGVAMQIIAQWTGGNGITYYTPQIFRLAGVRGEAVSLVASGAYAAVKLLFTMVFAWALIDMLGRRRCFLTGLTLQLLAHTYMAIYTSLLHRSRRASHAAIASVFVYAIGWSVGLCTVQYLYGTEILPTRIRAGCYAVEMGLHWALQYAVVRVTPPMLEGLKVWGAFALWAGVCAVGIVVLGAWAPETSGVPMERMGDVFEGRWYMGWKRRLSEGEKSP